MSVNLEKGQRIDLTKSNPGVSKYRVGLGWDVNGTSTGQGFDLDASVFVLGDNGKLLSEPHFVFYNNLKTPDEGIVHSGDNRTGQGDGDDETILVDFSKLTADAKELIFVVTIDKAQERSQNFGQVKNASIRVLDETSNTELMKFDLSEDFSVETAMTFGRLYKKDGEWKFEATGSGQQGGLQSYLNQYSS